MEPGILPGSKFWNTLNMSIKTTHTQNDIESASSDPLVPPPMVVQVYKDLYTSVQNKGYRDPDKREAVVYGKLMDHLDRVHRKRRNLRCYFSRKAFEILVVSGLTAFLVSSLAFERFNRRRALELRWWQWIAMAMMIFAGFPVVKFVTWVVLWPVTWWWRISKLAVYFVRRLKRTMDVTIWFCLVLLGWYAWFRPRLNHVRGEVSAIAAHQITRFLIALCLGSFMWLLKDVLYMKLEADLHYRQLFDRIKRTIVNLNGLLIVDPLDDHHHRLTGSDEGSKSQKNSESLVTPKMDTIVDPLIDHHHHHLTQYTKLISGSREGSKSRKKSEFSATPKMDTFVDPLKPGVKPCAFITYNTSQTWYKSMFKRIWRKEGDTGEQVTNIWMDVYMMNKDTVPIWILRRLEKEYLKWIKFNRPSFVDELLQDDEALLARANELFKSITNPKELDTFEEIKRGQLKASKGMLKLSEPELDFLFKRRSGEEEKTISHDEFLEWAVRAHKSSWGLERTLRSSKLALIKLNRLLSTFLLAVVLIIYLILTRIVTTAQLALLFAPFLAASFVFENSLKNMFHGLIFVFAMHPFDVGDRVVIEDAQLRVKELNILTSVFFKYDTGSDVIYPNSILAKTRIFNLDITPDQSDELDFVVKADTPPEDVKDLEFKIQKLLDEQPTFSSGTKVVKCTVCSFNHIEPLKMIVHFKYLVSYLTADRKAEHKSKILRDIMKFRKEMEMNKKEFPHGHEPYHLIFTVERAELVKGIEDMKKKIMRCQIVRDHFPGSKVVIAAIERKEVTIALYVRQIEPEGEEYFKFLYDQLSELGIKHAIKLSVKKGPRVICRPQHFHYCKWVTKKPDAKVASIGDQAVQTQINAGGDSVISSTQEIQRDDS